MEASKGRPWFVISFVLLGFGSLIAQAVLIRELLVIFQGNEVCLGLIFAVWLGGIALGAALAAYLADQLRPASGGLPLFISGLIALTIVLPVLIYLARISRGWLELSPGQPIPFGSVVWLSLLLIAPYSIFIGLVFPLACKIYVGQQDDKAAVQIGWVYIYEALGSLAGGVLFTFLLVGRWDAFTIAGAVNILLLISSLILARRINGGFKIILSGLGGLLLLVNIAGVAGGGAALHRSTLVQRWQVFKPGEEFITSRDSRYENLVIGKLQNQFQIYGNGQLVATFPDDYTYEPLAHFFLTEHPAPETVLLIGGGSEGLLAPILKHPPVRALHYVQLDPAMTEMMMPYLPEEEQRLINSRNGRLHLHYTDGRYFVKHTAERFDMVIIHLPDPGTALINRFYTVDFFREVKSILKPGGVVVTSVLSAENYFSELVRSYVGSVYDTLTAVYREVLVTPGDRAYFFACDRAGVVTFDIAELDKRWQARSIRTERFVSPAQFELLTQPERQDFIQRELTGPRTHYQNTDYQPVSYFFNLMLWDAMMSQSDAEPGWFFRLLKELRGEWGWVLGLAGLLLFIRLLYRQLTPGRLEAHQQFNSLAAIGAAGFAGLALELVLLFAFQNIYGYVYQVVGLIVAFFMFGLALGGWAANKWIMRQTRDWPRVLVLINGAIAVFALLVPVILRGLGSGASVEYGFVALIMAGGVLTGCIYPVANQLYLSHQPVGTATGRAAGLIDSADHFGAFIGALLVGVLFIPLFGIGQTCIFIAVLNLASVILLLRK